LRTTQSGLTQERETIMAILMRIGWALYTALSMFWEILWPIILGFTLSGIVQARYRCDERLK